ncbi:hypothetical protein THAOC_29519, partial [Thalassiosira oceanica]
HHVVEHAANKKHFLDNLDVSVTNSVLYYFPSFLQDSKHTLNILADALKIIGEVSLARALSCVLVWANEYGPTKVPAVADQVYSSGDLKTLN